MCKLLPLRPPRRRHLWHRRARLVALLWLLCGIPLVVPQSTHAQTVDTRQQIESTLARLGREPSLAQMTELMRSANAGKMSTDLLRLSVGYHFEATFRRKASFPGALALTSVSGAGTGQAVVVDATATSAEAAPALLNDLRALGLENGSTFGRVVSGRLPVASVSRAVDLPRLQGLSASERKTSAGRVQSQGDTSISGDVGRSQSGVDGRGIMVGTLSDSFDCSTINGTTAILGSAALDVSTNDLPQGIQVRKEGPCATLAPGGIFDEGRAMMQIIHDVAPGTTQAFYTAFNGQADFANGILDLRAAGSRVVVDDVIFFEEPMYQPGIIAQAVDTVVAAGTAYFSAAGNQGAAAYESNYRPSGQNPLAGFVPGNYEAHDFDPGPGVDVFQRVRFPQGSANLVFQWDEPFASAGGAGSRSDLDIFVFNNPPTQVLAASTNMNVVTGNPVERIFAAFAGQDVNIVLAKRTDAGGPNPTRVKYVDFRMITMLEHVSVGGAAYGHANSFNAEAAGAAPFFQTPRFGQSPPLLESFSARGGTDQLFDKSGARLATPLDVLKPNIVGPDAANTTFFIFDIPQDPDTFPNFSGTSAAAPHLAGAAALLLSQRPQLKPNEVYLLLEGSAVDMGAAGIDETSGFGLVDVSKSLRAALGPPSLSTRFNGAVPSNGRVRIADGQRAFLDATSSDPDGIGFPAFARLGNFGNLSFVWDFGGAEPSSPLDGFTANPQVTFRLLPGQTQRSLNVSVSTVDKTGATSSITTQVSVERPTPPIASIGINRRDGLVSVAAGVQVFLEGTASDPDGLGFPVFAGLGNFSPISFLWDFGGGTGQGALAGLAQNPGVIYALGAGEAQRDVTLTLSVPDTLGAVTTVSRALRVVRPTPPQVVARANGSAQTITVPNGSRVNFNATVSDANGLGYPVFGGLGNFSSVSFVWSFDGGTIDNPLVGLTQAPSAVFSLPAGQNERTFNVNVTVFDSQGASTVAAIPVRVVR